MLQTLPGTNRALPNPIRYTPNRRTESRRVSPALGLRRTMPGRRQWDVEAFLNSVQTFREPALPAPVFSWHDRRLSVPIALLLGLAVGILGVRVRNQRTLSRAAQGFYREDVAVYA